MINKKTSLHEILRLVKECKCDKCESGCRFGSGIFVEGEIKKAARFLGLNEDKFKKEYLEETEQFNKVFFRPRIKRGKNPYGPCIFFDEKKKCRIHEVKPMQCRLSMPCKSYGEDIMIWLMLNYIVDPSDPEAIRQFASYLAIGGKTFDDGKLEDFVKDKKMLKDILSFEKLK